MIDYDATAGIIATATRVHGTVIVLVLYRPGFYILLIFHLVISYLHKWGYIHPDVYHMEIAMGMTGVTGSLMTFFVVFYNGNVFARYQKLYELTKNMCEWAMYAASIIVREIKDTNIARKMCRLLLANCFLFFFERTPADDSQEALGSVSVEEWKQLAQLGLIDERESDILHAHCRKLGIYSNSSWLLLQWAMKLYRTKLPRLNELEKAFWTIRRCQDDVVEIMEMPMPFQYFHIMNMMMLLNLTLWAYALALERSYFATLIFVFVELVFLGIRELSVAMSDPYGDDEADFPLDDWMTQLYVRINSLCEDPWQASDFVPLDYVEPLPDLSEGESNQIKHLLTASCQHVPDASRASQRLSMSGTKRRDSDSKSENRCTPTEQAQPEKRGSVLSTNREEEEAEEDDEGDD